MCSLSDGLYNVIAGHLIEKWRQPTSERGWGGKTKKETGSNNKRIKGWEKYKLRKI